MNTNSKNETDLSEKEKEYFYKFVLKLDDKELRSTSKAKEPKDIVNFSYLTYQKTGDIIDTTNYLEAASNNLLIGIYGELFCSLGNIVFYLSTESSFNYKFKGVNINEFIETGLQLYQKTVPIFNDRGIHLCELDELMFFLYTVKLYYVINNDKKNIYQVLDIIEYIKVNSKIKLIKKEPTNTILKLKKDAPTHQLFRKHSFAKKYSKKSINPYKSFEKSKNTIPKTPLKREIEERITKMGIKAIGVFDKKGHLVKGELQFPSGMKYVGEFDGEYLVEGEKHFPDNSKDIGKFKNNKLVEGEIHYPNGAINKGIFDDNQDLIYGEKHLPGGFKLIGEFKNRYLIKGEIHDPDGTRYIGKFVDSDLVEGSIHYPDGQIETGKFVNESLVNGTRYLSDGSKQIGLFDDSGNFIKGEMCLTDGRKWVGEFVNGKYFKVLTENGGIEGYYYVVDDNNLAIVSYEEYSKNTRDYDKRKETPAKLIVEKESLYDDYSDLSDNQKKAVLNEAQKYDSDTKKHTKRPIKSFHRSKRIRR